VLDYASNHRFCQYRFKELEQLFQLCAFWAPLLTSNIDLIEQETVYLPLRLKRKHYMSEENIRKAESYYQAINNKDLATAAQYLHPDVKVLSPMMEIEGKEVVLDGVQRFMAIISTLTIRERFSSGDKVVLIYDIESPAPIGTLRASALITFRDNLIIRIELFFDARPFEK